MNYKGYFLLRFNILKQNGIHKNKGNSLYVFMSLVFMPLVFKFYLGYFGIFEFLYENFQNFNV